MNAMSNISIVPRVNLRNLSLVGYANGFSQHHYRADRIADVLGSGFFDDATILHVGDHISVSAPDGGAMLYVGPQKKVIAMCWCDVAE